MTRMILLLLFILGTIIFNLDKHTLGTIERYPMGLLSILYCNLFDVCLMILQEFVFVSHSVIQSSIFLVITIVFLTIHVTSRALYMI